MEINITEINIPIAEVCQEHHNIVEVIRALYEHMSYQ